jgi:hypothetical protein
MWSSPTYLVSPRTIKQRPGHCETPAGRRGNLDPVHALNEIASLRSQ